MAPLRIKQQALIHREQAPIHAEVAIGEQPQSAQRVGLAHQARAAQHRCAAQQRRLLRGGAPGIKQTRANPQPRGRAQAQIGDVLEAAARLQADASRRQPEQAASLTQSNRLVDHGGAQHPHHHRTEARVLEGHPGDGTAGVKGIEAMEQIATRTRATGHQAGSTAAARAAVHQGP